MVNGVFIDEFIIVGSSSNSEDGKDFSINFTHYLDGPFFFFTEEEKNKFVSNLTLTFSQLYNSVEITEVNKP